MVSCYTTPMRNILTQILLLGAVFCAISACSENQNKQQGFIEGEYTYISSSQSGYLTQLAVSRGEHIELDQLLFVLDPQPESSLLAEAQNSAESAKEALEDLIASQRNTIIEAIKAQLRQAEAQFTLAKENLDRNQKLYQSATISKSTLDDYTAQYNTASQKVAEVKSNLAEAELGARTHRISAQRSSAKAAENQVEVRAWDLQQKKQYSPFKGYVFDTFYTEGEFIPPATPVLAVLDAKHIKVVFYISEVLLSRIKPGQKITFGCDGCPKPGSAMINYISPQAEYTPPVIYSNKTRVNLVFRVEARILGNPIGKFNPGQPVDVYLELNNE